jgi:hypothetical protein
MQKTLVELHQLEDVTPADVLYLQKMREQAEFELAVARTAARQKIEKEMQSLSRRITDIEEKLAKLNADPEPAALPVQVVQNLLGPAALWVEKKFGSGDSPGDIVRILQENQQAILIEEMNITRAKAAYDEWVDVKIPGTIARLQRCLQSHARQSGGEGAQ